MDRTPVILGALVALCQALLLGACGASASFSDHIYDDGTVRYRVGPLAGFSRVELEDNDLAFFHRQYGTISVNSTCRDYEDVPQEALLNHLLFGTRQHHYRVDETATLDGRGAKHVLVDLELDGVPLSLEVFVLQKDGCVYDLTHTSARTAPPQARETFLAFVGHFAVLRTRLD